MNKSIKPWHIFIAFFVTFFIFVLLIFLIALFTTKTFWNENNYPNPTTNLTACNMAYPSHICDPDTVIFSKTRRNLIASKLESFQKETQNLNFTKSNKNDKCDRKGVTAAIALTANIHDDSEEGRKNFAQNILSNWNLDSKCKKSFLILVHRDLKYDEITDEYETAYEFFIALDSNVPFTECGFWKIYYSIGSGIISTDLSTILDGIIEKIKNDEIDTDTECSKDEAQHFGYGWVYYIFGSLFFISWCFIALFIGVKFFKRNRPNSNHNQQTRGFSVHFNPTTSTLRHTSANQSLIHKM